MKFKQVGLSDIKLTDIEKGKYYLIDLYTENIIDLYHYSKCGIDGYIEDSNEECIIIEVIRDEKKE